MRDAHIYLGGDEAIVIGRPLNKSQIKAAMRWLPVEVKEGEVVLQISQHALKSFLAVDIGPLIIHAVIDLAIPDPEFPEGS